MRRRSLLCVEVELGQLDPRAHAPQQALLMTLHAAAAIAHRQHDLAAERVGRVVRIAARGRDSRSPAVAKTLPVSRHSKVEQEHQRPDVSSKRWRKHVRDTNERQRRSIIAVGHRPPIDEDGAPAQLVRGRRCVGGEQLAEALGGAGDLLRVDHQHNAIHCGDCGEPRRRCGSRRNLWRRGDERNGSSTGSRSRSRKCILGGGGRRSQGHRNGRCSRSRCGTAGRSGRLS
mmetsp:Transcript_52400/g.120444  ORF Transcript_52400/g.120444 Transcript_52400/m.120444 type:complete len:230 (+) Transcript_52400:576-1265(+)